MDYKPVTDELDEDACWQAVQNRDEEQDGRFVYAVRSTGVFCRPSCSSRRPKRVNVLFFETAQMAQAAGYRACKRCRPLDQLRPDARIDLVEQACQAILAQLDRPLSLAALADRLHVSPTYLHRVFKAVTGLTPRQYLAGKRAESLKAQLRNGSSVTTALYEAGYSSTSRIYEVSSRRLGMTPGKYRQGGAGMEIRFTVVGSPLGHLLIAATTQGICAVRFGDTEQELLDELRGEFPRASLARDESALHGWTETLVAYLAGGKVQLNLPLDLRATAFQLRVWEALRRIPYGETRSYAEVAEAIGEPKAVRAVANACAANPAALVTPCHRVVRLDGGLGGYRWGVERKQALLERERAGS